MDLEWNVGYKQHRCGYFDEIIEIGAVKLDEEFNIIDEFSSLVRPSVNYTMNRNVKKLTSIEQKELRQAENFSKVYKKFISWCGYEENIFLTWSTMDILVMVRNIRFFDIAQEITAMNKYIDLQEFVQGKFDRDKGQMLSLSAAAELLEIEVEDMDMHRALDDSIVTAKCLQAVKSDDFFNHILLADDKFYKRILFKNKILTDYENAVIEKSKMMIRCPKCGVFVKRMDKWKVVNKAFLSKFECGICHSKYKGRVKIKMEFDKILYNSKITAIET